MSCVIHLWKLKQIYSTSNVLSKAWCKTATSALAWSYCSLALSCQYNIIHNLQKFFAKHSVYCLVTHSIRCPVWHLAGRTRLVPPSEPHHTAPPSQHCKPQQPGGTRQSGGYVKMGQAGWHVKLGTHQNQSGENVKLGWVMWYVKWGTHQSGDKSKWWDRLTVKSLIWDAPNPKT